MGGRLASSHPEIACVVQASSHAKQERASREVVAFLLSTLPALAAELGQTPSAELYKVALTVAEEADKRYLALHAAGDPMHLEAFSLARAASAVALASRGEPSEAIYEGLHALRNDEPLVNRVLASLRGEF